MVCGVELGVDFREAREAEVNVDRAGVVVHVLEVSELRAEA